MKPREFWVTQWEPMAGADYAWRNPDSAKTHYKDHQVYVQAETRQQIEIIHVIEKSAYDQLLEQANKLSSAIKRWPERHKALDEWDEFKKSQGID